MRITILSINAPTVMYAITYQEETRFLTSNLTKEGWPDIASACESFRNGSYPDQTISCAEFYRSLLVGFKAFRKRGDKFLYSEPEWFVEDTYLVEIRRGENRVNALVKPCNLFFLEQQVQSISAIFDDSGMPCGALTKIQHDIEELIKKQAPPDFKDKAHEG